MPSKGDSRFWGMGGNLKRVREKPSMSAQSAIQKSLCRAVKAAQTNEKTPKRNEAAAMNGFSGNTASINAPATNAALTTANGLLSNQPILCFTELHRHLQPFKDAAVKVRHGHSVVAANIETFATASDSANQ